MEGGRVRKEVDRHLGAYVGRHRTIPFPIKIEALIIFCRYYFSNKHLIL